MRLTFFLLNVLTTWTGLFAVKFGTDIRGTQKIPTDFGNPLKFPVAQQAYQNDSLSSEISEQILDGLAPNFIHIFMVPKRMNPKDLGDPLRSL